jgi:hypothetical protein
MLSATHFIPSGFEVDQLNAAVELEMSDGRASEPALG